MHAKLLTLLLGGSQLVQAAVAGPRLTERDGASPSLPHDDKATGYCTWWIDYTETLACDTILQNNQITITQFKRWNPSVKNDCKDMTIGQSYCVEAAFEPAQPEPEPSSEPKPSPTKPSNGIQTPDAIQPGMVSNCAKFHYIANSDVKCADVISYQKITLADFVKWNPTVGDDCRGMWTKVNVCVGVIGGSPAPAPATTTTTTAGNGVQTPQPTQPGMVSNCNKFHWIAKGVNCDQVISYQKITRADFVKWNPTVLDDCRGMWAEVNVCVGVIGGSPAPTSTTTTTTAGNGVQTPQPIQPGMVNNCNKFHWIAKGVNCDQVISYQKITRAEFVRWNPTVLDDCRGMWAEVNVCVGVVGGSPAPAPTTTTTAGNGIQTPQPIQPGMVSNCKKFHWIANSNVKCADVISYQKITLADFVKWNPGVGADCRNMWSGVNQCVGV
ncbi:hypothetical protein KAF25_002512 [Fusarium avenaceum]|uniref:LysM domain-containing protein n=1 Tax=Fusarium avenaceum TaxID=40199 RepID=A0A9P7KT41_9HYPO|nr:hypothetical protein KAF25_002512 [Fusarium avenaceum]